MLDRELLQAWLEPLDALPLECDGMTHVVSALLTREAIEHVVCVGRLEIDGVGAIAHHWWVDVGSGLICDWRARAWLGNSRAVPHGVFAVEPGIKFQEKGRLFMQTSPFVFGVLAGMPVEAYQPMPAEVVGMAARDGVEMP